MSLLIVISAPSGAGKTTLCQRLLKERHDLTLSISCTTRAPRGQERAGEHYLFLDAAEFQRRIQAGDFAEWALVHGNYYGTLRETIESSFSDGKSVLLDIDVQGAESLRKAFPHRSLLIFIAPPSMEELETRLRNRGTDSEESILKRMLNAKSEMEKNGIFDHVIINDTLEQAYGELKKLTSSHLGPEGASNG